MEKQNKPRFNWKQAILPVLLIGLGISAVVGGLYAKYTKQIGDTQATVRARKFYFSSDFLVEGGAEHTLNPGTEFFTFELRNHDDELRFAERDITYQLTINNGATIEELTGSGDNKLIGGQISNKEIQISNLQEGIPYTVVAVGEAGYVKTLSATFTVKSQNKEAYVDLEMDTSGAFVLLTVWTENLSGEVVFTVPAGLIPDGTDSWLAGIQNYNGAYQKVENQVAGNLGVYSSHTYRFFMETPFTNYIADDFGVTVDGKTANEKVPN